MERHYVPRPGTCWPYRAAALAHDSEIACAGITTVFDATAIGEGILNKGRYRMVVDAANAVKISVGNDILRTEHYLHIRCEVASSNVVELFNSFQNDPLVKLVLLMDHTPGERQFVDKEKLKVYYQCKYGLSDS